MAEPWRCFATQGDTMETIRFSELGTDFRSAMQGKRWLLLTGEELAAAGAALVFSELEDVLVAVDHRGTEIQSGLWMRAVHLLLVDDETQVLALQTSSVSKVLAVEGPIEAHLW